MSTTSDPDATPAQRVADWAHEQQDAYAPGEDRHLGLYLVTMSTYAASVGAGMLAVRASKQQVPDRFLLRDLAVLAVGTHKAARLVAKDSVTSPLRAPVARFEGPGGPSEVQEAPRGEGHRHVLGELVTCPFCVTQWLATAGMFGMVLAPRATRFVASTFAVVAVSDFLQYAFAFAQDRA